MRDWFKCLALLGLIAVAISVATPELRICLHSGSTAFGAHAPDCAHSSELAHKESPAQAPGDEDDCCAICQYGFDSSAILFVLAFVFGLRTASRWQALPIAVADLCSQLLNGCANQARAPPAIV
jgi:hypothetical protein